MGRMNFEIPDEINKELDNESREKKRSKENDYHRNFCVNDTVTWID